MRSSPVGFSFFLLTCFLTGSILSFWLTGGSPTSETETLQLSVLGVFIFFVSYDVGSKLTSGSLSKIARETAILVLSTIAGSALAGFIFSLLTGFGLKLSLGVSLGMGWYTFDGPALGAFAGATFGALGFLSNFLREVFTLVSYNPAASLLGRARPITLGGATTMDTTLTVIRRASDPGTTALAFANGAVLSFFIPILVTIVLT
jgi:uncharacterized membrane protein YbjE (DUF340 family)